VFLALDSAIKGISRLEQQIDLLLNINRAEAGQELTDQEPVLVHSLVNDVTELLSPRAGAYRVRLRAELPETLPMVLGNRNMLSWSLENLVDNAIKFNPENEEVIVRASIVVTPDRPTGGTSEAIGCATGPSRRTTLRISVIDRGPGIAPDDRERIFRKFYQLRRPEGKKGSGMGLYFCRLAVEAHGGRIWVDNNLEGPGCTFSFTLPLPTD
jgi:signal transduction histidine kinase